MHGHGNIILGLPGRIQSLGRGCSEMNSPRCLQRQRPTTLRALWTSWLRTCINFWLETAVDSYAVVPCELALYKCKDWCRVKEETVVVAQDTERTRPWYDAEVIKEIFIVVQTETMNFINIGGQIKWLRVNSITQILGRRVWRRKLWCCLKPQGHWKWWQWRASMSYRGSKVQPCIIWLTTRYTINGI